MVVSQQVLDAHCVHTLEVISLMSWKELGGKQKLCPSEKGVDVRFCMHCCVTGYLGIIQYN